MYGLPNSLDFRQCLKSEPKFYFSDTVFRMCLKSKLLGSNFRHFYEMSEILTQSSVFKHRGVWNLNSQKFVLDKFGFQILTVCTVKHKAVVPNFLSPKSHFWSFLNFWSRQGTSTIYRNTIYRKWSWKWQLQMSIMFRLSNLTIVRNH